MGLGLLGAAFQIGAGAFGLASQVAAQKSEQKYADQVFQINSKLARDAYFENTARAYRERRAQRRQAGFGAEQVRQDALDAAGLMATTKASSGGASAEYLINAIFADEARFQNDLAQEQRRLDVEAERGVEMQALGLQAELFSLNPNPQSKVDVLGGIFNIGSGALSSYASLNAISNG
jgi:hypothetical protein